MIRVAVCGLAPGAGTTLLATLLARKLGDGCAVADGGLLSAPPARAALAPASHVVWTVPAGPDAGALAVELLLEAELAPPPGAALELLTVVATRRGAVPPRAHRALREVVAARGERLVFVPHVRALAGRRTDGRLPSTKRLAGPLAAIAAVLARGRAHEPSLL